MRYVKTWFVVAFVIAAWPAVADEKDETKKDDAKPKDSK